MDTEKEIEELANFLAPLMSGSTTPIDRARDIINAGYRKSNLVPLDEEALNKQCLGFCRERYIEDEEEYAEKTGAILTFIKQEIIPKFVLPKNIELPSLEEIEKVIAKCTNENLDKGFGERKTSYQMDNVLSQAIRDLIERKMR